MFAARPRAAPAREENARAVSTDMSALRVLAGDEIGYVRALQTNPAAADDEAEDLRLVGKFGALLSTILKEHQNSMENHEISS